MAASLAELQLGILGVNCGRPGVLTERLLIIARRFESNSTLIRFIPFRLLRVI